MKISLGPLLVLLQVGGDAFTLSLGTDFVIAEAVVIID